MTFTKEKPNKEPMSREEFSNLLSGNVDKDSRLQNSALEYWIKRCECAELYISESPCDPDHTERQLNAYRNWQESKKF